MKIAKIIAGQQFHPQGPLGLLVNPFYFARKNLARNLQIFACQMQGSLLDVGCGTQPYRKIFSQVTSYLGLEYDTPDNRQKKAADFFYQGTSFPFADDEFDSLLVTQVLEHVFEPDNFLQECRRVLRPKGKALITVPFVWDEHEQPYDYARYTHFGLKHLLTQNGFEVIGHQKSTNDITCLFQLMNTFIYKVFLGNKISRTRKLAVLLLSAFFNIFGQLMVIILPIKNNDLYLDNIILIEKYDR